MMPVETITIPQAAAVNGVAVPLTKTETAVPAGAEASAELWTGATAVAQDASDEGAAAIAAVQATAEAAAAVTAKAVAGAMIPATAAAGVAAAEGAARQGFKEQASMMASEDMPIIVTQTIPAPTAASTPTPAPAVGTTLLTGMSTLAMQQSLTCRRQTWRFAMLGAPTAL